MAVVGFLVRYSQIIPFLLRGRGLRRRVAVGCSSSDRVRSGLAPSDTTGLCRLAPDGLFHPGDGEGELAVLGNPD